MTVFEEGMRSLDKSMQMCRKKGTFAPATVEEMKQLQELCDDKMPEDMRKFFSECMPQEEVKLGGYMLYPLSRILEENTNYVPGCIIKPLGFVTFASTLDGDAVALDITKPDGHVYQCSHSLISDDGMSFYAKGKMVHFDLNYENVIKCSFNVGWYFSDFIKWIRSGRNGSIGIIDWVIEQYEKNN